MTKRFNSTLLGILASVFLVAPPCALANQYSHGWRGVSSSGVVDSTGYEHVWHVGHMTTLQYSAPAESKVVLRFDINPDKILFPDTYTLQARLYDGGGGERVVIRLKELDYRSGAIRTRMTLNSDSFDQDGWQSISETEERYVGFSISDDDKCYYIEVELKKNTSRGLPILMGLSINGYQV